MTKKEMTRAERHCLAWYEAREKGSRIKAKPAEISNRPMTIAG
jgi:hypothetical protein